MTKVARLSRRLCAALLVGLALLPGPAGASPSLKETVDWIVDKLIRNGKKQKYGSSEGEYAETVRAAADECRLVVTTNVWLDGDKIRTTYAIPMRDLRIVRRKPLGANSSSYCMLYIATTRKTVKVDQIDQFSTDQRWDGDAYIPFSFEKEAEIFSRLEAALTHFSSLSKKNPKCRSKEAF
ncbi:hypothetical protein [Bosea sp. ANAM02]|uniref:hypothetical protein n=1 Tax=Bosea sp. ANAM02 TaxID=2020412 RepID=UPI00140F0299|nr:hypothetical protein [Bosea sp. ANAM02]BCB21812.1 hypothetical protein OCUBac02_47060 [Bosea sp. ANAM02]